MYRLVSLICTKNNRKWVIFPVMFWLKENSLILNYCKILNNCMFYIMSYICHLDKGSI